MGNRPEIKEILGLKTTVLSQQLYKQYQYLDATIRRLEIQLKKAMVSVNLDVAAGTDSSSSSSKTSNTQFDNCVGKSREETLYCLRSNYSKLDAEVNAKRCKAVKEQIAKDLNTATAYTKTKDSKKTEDRTCYDKKTITDCSACLSEYFSEITAIQDKIDEMDAKKSGYNRW